jgi:glycosyltransferase involved in cell wall biosynthesis
VTLVVERDLSEDRVSSGWTAGDCGTVKAIVAPSPNQIRELVDSASQGTVHILSGYRNPRHIALAFSTLSRNRSRVGLMCERPDPRGLVGLARRVLYTAERLYYDCRIDFILAIGGLCAHYMNALGYPSHKIFPFAYTTEVAPALAVPVEESGFRLGFIGQLVDRKGLRYAICALASLVNLDWQLTVVGDGPERSSLESQVRTLGIADRVRFIGPMRNDDALRELQGWDLLILPSLHDGWGAVVNEGLMCGVPVVCSDACGARDLLYDPSRGAVFKAGEAADLASALVRCLKRGKRTASTSARIRRWSDRIQGDAIARYFLAVLDAVYADKHRPEAPWLK